MKIGGFIKTSLINYPGKIAAVVFTQGCNLRCKYCHNAELVLPEQFDENKIISKFFVLDYLEKNKTKLDAVVITGGEPTIQPGLIEFLKLIRLYGLYIKIDTNGTNPEVLQSLIDLELIDYIAMDIKAPFEVDKYSEIAGISVSSELLEKIKKSKDIILHSEVKHEFRTTAVKEMISKDDMINIAESIKGGNALWLQEFNPEYSLDDSFKTNNGISADTLRIIANDLKGYVSKVGVR